MDQKIFRWVNDHHTPVLDRILGLFSWLTELGFAWIVTAIVLAGRGDKLHALYLLSAIFGAFAIGALAQRVFPQAERPYLALDGVRQRGFPWATNPFPSLHTSTSVAACYTLAYFYPATTWWLVAAALLIGYSRVYVGMHYPRDIIAGALVGLLTGYLVTMLL